MAKRATKKSPKKPAAKKRAAKRELISPRGDKRYIRRDAARPYQGKRRCEPLAVAGSPQEGEEGGKVRAGRSRRPEARLQSFGPEKDACQTLAPRLDLFGNDALPEGFRYQPDFLSREEEQSLLKHIVPLPFREFEFQGFTGKRRVVSCGWRDHFNGGRPVQDAEEIPDFLAVADARARNSFAAIVARPSSHQVLITEYTPVRMPSAGTRTARCSSATSSASRSCPSCTFRLRLQNRATAGSGAVLRHEPRSVYLSARALGAVAKPQEHSIPGVDSLRDSASPFSNVLEGSSPDGKEA